MKARIAYNPLHPTSQMPVRPLRIVLLRLLFLAIAGVLPFCRQAHAEIVFDWATIGNAGNRGDLQSQGTYGSVDYTYRISKYEVTNAQYATFLNSVAASDPNGLYHSGMRIIRSGTSGNYQYTPWANHVSHAVTSVSYFNAMRFVNWMENGQPLGAQGLGTTESGTYSIANGLTEVRALGARFFIPSEDEWYKAAYHDPNAPGGYWDYPTMSNTAPSSQMPPGGNNSGNFGGFSFVRDTTPVGAYQHTTSASGTFDQAGNVLEWNEGLVGNGRGLRGGAFFMPGGFGDQSAASLRFSGTPGSTGFQVSSNFGFRIGSVVPEPSASLLVLAGLGGLAARRRRPG